MLLVVCLKVHVSCVSQIGQWNATRSGNDEQHFALPASPPAEWLWSLQVWGCQWHQPPQSGCAHSHTRWAENIHTGTQLTPIASSSLRKHCACTHVIEGVSACDIVLQAEMWHCITLARSVHTDSLSSSHPFFLFSSFQSLGLSVF